ncbi:AraC family transcriptional regulator [Gandjariella thermophila]|nr:AraC family transcriptional regulator [Gandjariella thermophila]
MTAVDDPTPAVFFQRGIAGIRAIVEVGACSGVPVATCLAGTGIEQAMLRDDTAVVRSGQELIVAHNLVRAAGDPPGLGFAVGSRFRLRTYGVWGFALLASPTLRDAADVALRYVELTYATAGIELQENGDEVHLVVDDASLPRPVRRFVVEREIAAVRTILDTILGEPFTPRRVELRFPRPDIATSYESLAGAPVTFGAARNAIVADAALLDRPLPQADPHTMRVCERECRALLARRVDQRFAGRVCELLMRRQNPIPDMSIAAAELHVSTRTLHRRLAMEGTSFRRLLDEVRHVLAIEMLTAGLGVEQVAVRLGYADAPAFIRAFRRWTGDTPGAYRTPPARAI